MLLDLRNLNSMKLRQYITEAKKLLTVGLILTDGNVFLAVHPTKQLHWDIPKGIQDEGESTLETLKREMKEETGVNLSRYKIVKVGRFPYNKKKDIFIYSIHTNDLPLTATMRCTSTFGPRQLPEVDDYRYMTYSLAKTTHKPQTIKILKKVLFKK